MLFQVFVNILRLTWEVAIVHFELLAFYYSLWPLHVFTITVDVTGLSTDTLGIKQKF